MKKAYLYRLYPTEEQAQALQQQLDVAREVYNACLQERREAYRMAGVTVGYYAQANQLTALPRGVPGDRADIAAVNFSMLQAICRRAQRAYDNFFRRIKAGQPAGYPRFVRRRKLGTKEETLTSGRPMTPSRWILSHRPHVKGSPTPATLAVSNEPSGMQATQAPLTGSLAPVMRKGKSRRVNASELLA